MLSKEELLTKDISELENIAQSLGVTNEFDDDKEGLIYAILDRQADRGAAEQAAPLKRKCENSQERYRPCLYCQWPRG